MAGRNCRVIGFSDSLSGSAWWLWPAILPNSAFTKGLSNPVVGYLPHQWGVPWGWRDVPIIILQSGCCGMVGYGSRVSMARKNKEGALWGKKTVAPAQADRRVHVNTLPLSPRNIYLGDGRTFWLGWDMWVRRNRSANADFSFMQYYWYTQAQEARSQVSPSLLHTLLAPCWMAWVGWGKKGRTSSY